jgi:uncharacterized YccA/Bax inhibitor family protein
MMRSSNPTLADDTFTRFGYSRDATDTMSINGVVFKTFILLLFTLLSAGFVWSKFYQSGGNAAAINIWMMAGAFGGFIVALVTAFKVEWAPMTAIPYAVLEGFFIGGLSSILEASFPGIVIQATGLTFATLAVMLFAYQSGIIPASQSFRLGIVAATGGLAVFYLIAFALSFFNIQVPGIFGNGWFGIAFSLFAVTIAALNFVLDFDFIVAGSRNRAPKFMEWYGAFAMMVTLIWLYIEFLRLLSKLRDR